MESVIIVVVFGVLVGIVLAALVTLVETAAAAVVFVLVSQPLHVLSHWSRIVAHKFAAKTALHRVNDKLLCLFAH